MLARIYSGEYEKWLDDYKERTLEVGTRYGFTRQLYSSEIYDLAWLLQLKDRGWLPQKVELFNVITKRDDHVNAEEHMSFLFRVYARDNPESRREWKDHCRTYGRGNLNLMEFEKYDLPWLLEIFEKDLGFPYAVKIQTVDDTVQTVAPLEWIRQLLSGEIEVPIISL